MKDKRKIRKVKSSPIVKKKTLKKVIKIISDFGYDKEGDYLGNKGNNAWENGDL